MGACFVVLMQQGKNKQQKNKRKVH